MRWNHQTGEDRAILLAALQAVALLEKQVVIALVVDLQLAHRWVYLLADLHHAALEALIQRTEAFDPQLHAYITPTFDLARQQAKQAEAEIASGKYRGPLHGIPFALKDIYDTAGILTSFTSRCVPLKCFAAAYAKL